MDISQTSEHNAQDSLDVSNDTFINMVQLLSILGNEDAFNIFFYTRNGFSSSKLAIIDLELSQKRFYTRLKDLIEIGLIKKDKGMYVHTSLGKIFYEIKLSLINILEKREKIDLLDQFTNKDTFSIKDFLNIKDIVSQGSTRINSILNVVYLPFENDQLLMLSEYEKYMDKINMEISKSKNNVIIASKNIDIKIMDSLIESIKRGVEVKIISQKIDLKDNINKLHIMFSSKIIESMLEYFNSEELNKQIRESEIPCNFYVIDDKNCFFELPCLNDSTFSVAFFINDTEIGEKYTSYFDTLWKSSKKISIPNIVQKGES